MFFVVLNYIRLSFVQKWLIISKKPWFTGIQAGFQAEFTTNLLLLRERALICRPEPCKSCSAGVTPNVLWNKFLQKVRKPPSERGRNYTPLREVVHCALPGASCRQQMIFTNFQSAPIITRESTLPLRWLRQLPLCGLATRKSFRKHISSSKLKLYNSVSDKSE